MEFIFFSLTYNGSLSSYNQSSFQFEKSEKASDVFLEFEDFLLTNYSFHFIISTGN